MTAQEIAQWVLGLFVTFAGILAIGKLLAERDETRGYCNVYFRKQKKRSEWFEKHSVRNRVSFNDSNKMEL